MTTLRLGGAAECLAEVGGIAEARDAIRFARSEGLPIRVLGGGSNVVIADEGVSGVTIHPTLAGIEFETGGHRIAVTVSAGNTWGEFVAMAVERNLAGVECLSGIPGSAGAAPIQNIGAYGQEVASVIDRVRVLDLESLEDRWIGRDRCGFGYRTSIFRQCPGRYLVLAARFILDPGGRPMIEYEELEQALAIGRATPSLSVVRDAVLELRRSKSMVIDDGDPNRRSVGSFFLNPLVDSEGLEAPERSIRGLGRSGRQESIPSFQVADGRFKVSAAWLIERAGFEKGMRRGSVGISTAHSLALVHHGGGTTAELIGLAREIRDGVARETGIELQPEPVFFGFPTANPLLDKVES